MHPRIPLSSAVLVLLTATACGSWVTTRSKRPGSTTPASAPLGPRASAHELGAFERRIAPRTPAPPTVAARLRATKLTDLAFSADGNGGYRDVLRTVQTVAGVPILLTPAARAIIDEEGLALTMTITAPLSVASFLDVLASRSDRLGWEIDDGVVVFGDKSETYGALRNEIYDVRVLTFPRTEFLPPQLLGIPTGEESEEPRTGGEADEKVQIVSGDELVAQIKMATDDGSYWDGDSGAGIEFLDSGYVLVKAHDHMHARVARFLGS